jgi:hypothetical protein
MALLNPIFLGSKYLKRENNEVLIDKVNAYKYFKKLYIISPLNEKNINYDKYINEEQYNLLVKNLIIHEVDFSVMVNNLLSKNILIFKKEDLEIINKFNLDLEDFVMVIPILTITYSNIIKFSSINIDNDLRSLYIYLTLIDYFGKDKQHFLTNINIDKKIDNIKGNNYYSLPFNVNKNYSVVFNNRNTSDKIIHKKFDYNFTIKKNRFLSLASIQYKNNDLFTLTPKSDISKTQFNKLFDYLMIYNNNNNYKLSKSNINLVNKCLANPKYSHLILNNYNVLDKIKTLIFKNKFYYKSLISYSWIRFYQDECILDNKITSNDDIIFDINTANILPVYNLPIDNIYYNPYLPLLIDSKSLNIENNIFSVAPYLSTINNFGVCTLEEFKARLNLFCTNDYKKNLFEKIDFKENNMIICGSVMPACLPKNYTLFNVFDKKEPHNLARFFKEYYSEADIDIAINVKNHFNFCKNVSKIFEQIMLNFCSIFQYGEPNLIKKTPIKKVFLFVKENYIDDLCRKNNLVLNDIRYNQDKLFELLKDIIIQEHDFNVLKQNNLSEDDNIYIKNNIPEFAYTYEELLMNNIEINTLITIHKTIYDNSDTISDISYHSKKNFALRTELRYKITSPLLDHNIEVFQNRSENPFKIISNFHLNCVRCYYDGDNVYLTPSCVSSYMTNINIDCKYFVSNKSPWEIINKYRMRGFGTLLNKNELENFTKWSKEDLFWKKLYATTKINGFLSIESSIFKPRIYNTEHFINSKSMIDVDDPEYKTININEFKLTTLSYIVKGYSTINTNNGNIIPLKSYYLDIDYAIDNMQLDIN